MTNNETEDTPVTYVTTGEPASMVYVAPVGTLLREGEAIGTWERVGTSMGEMAQSFEILGEVAKETGKVIQTKFVQRISINMDTPSVKVIATIWGMSKAEVRRLKGYVVRKPLIHKGRKPTW